MSLDRESLVQCPRFDWKLDGLWLIGFGVLALFFFRSVVFTDKGHIPYDIVGFHFPLLFSLADGVRTGSLPLWDPYAYSGYPLVGNIQAAMLYPVNWLFIIPFVLLTGYLPYRAVELILVFHYFLAAAFAYYFARGFGLARSAAAVSGIVYAFGGFYASQAQHLGLLSGAAWIPLGLHFLRTAINLNCTRYAVGAGLCFALNVLAGFPIGTVPVMVLVLGGFVYWASRSIISKSGLGRLRDIILQFGITGLVAAGISAAQLLPALELVGHSAQATERSTGAFASPWHPESLLTYFLPNLFGAAGPQEYWGKGNFTQAYAYIGILPLILIILSLFTPRRRGAIILWAGAVLFLLWSFGELTPVAHVMYTIIPWPINQSIETYTARSIVDLLAAVMAGFGAHHILRSRKRSRRALQVGVLGTLGASLLLVLIFLSLGFGFGPFQEREGSYLVAVRGLPSTIMLMIMSAGVVWGIGTGRLKARISGLIVIALVAGDLFYYNSEKHFNFAQDMPEVAMWPGNTSRLPLTEFLQRDVDFTTRTPFRMDNVGINADHWGTAARVLRLQNANGSDPLLLRDYARYRDSFSQVLRSPDTRTFRGPLLNSNLLDLLNIKYVVVTGADVEKDLSRIDPDVSPSKYRLVLDSWYKVFENTEVLPRAFIVPRAKIAQTHESALDELKRASFEPRQYVVLEGDVQGIQERLAKSPVTVGDAIIIEYTPNRVDIVTRQDSPGLLFLGDIFFPGWQAFVDGRPEHIYRANYIFRAVYLDAGEHAVSFVYDPGSLKIGIGITVMTFVLILGIVVWGGRRREDVTRYDPPNGKTYGLAGKSDPGE